MNQLKFITRSYLLFILFIKSIINQANNQTIFLSLKKGVGLSSEYGSSQLKLLNVNWYYNWGSQSNINTNNQDLSPSFIPMIYSKNSLNNTFPDKFNYILGFNEPDNQNQSDMSYASSLILWPDIVKIANKQSPIAQIGSPAMAGSSVDDNSWLVNFMSSKPKVDFITIHWYKGIDYNKFISDVNEIIKKFNLPVWITEFAPQTSSSSRENPNKYNQVDVNKFIEKTLVWMEGEPMVQRYAWHNSKITNSTCNLFNLDGSLTETGRVYSMDYRTLNESQILQIKNISNKSEFVKYSFIILILSSIILV